MLGAALPQLTTTTGPCGPCVLTGALWPLLCRINKKESVKDREQKEAGTFYYLVSGPAVVDAESTLRARVCLCVRVCAFVCVMMASYWKALQFASAGALPFQGGWLNGALPPLAQDD